MPRSSFQKLKIIYIMEYLLKNSDEDHAVTTSQIIAYLKSHDTLMQLIVQYHNGSRLWCTCGWKPDELAAKFSGIGAFPGQEASSPEGMMDEKDIIRKMKELGLKVLE